jgi:hypothetical protein
VRSQNGRENAWCSQEDLGRTNTTTSPSGEAALFIHPGWFRTDTGIAGAVDSWLYQELLVIKKSADALDRGTG